MGLNDHSNADVDLWLNYLKGPDHEFESESTLSADDIWQLVDLHNGMFEDDPETTSRLHHLTKTDYGWAREHMRVVLTKTSEWRRNNT